MTQTTQDRIIARMKSVIRCIEMGVHSESAIIDGLVEVGVEIAAEIDGLKEQIEIRLRETGVVRENKNQWMSKCNELGDTIKLLQERNAFLLTSAETAQAKLAEARGIIGRYETRLQEQSDLIDRYRVTAIAHGQGREPTFGELASHRHIATERYEE